MKFNLETIKNYRIRKGLSQDEVSKITGIDISLFEKGFTKGISLSKLHKLANLYGCDDLDFYSGEMIPDIKTHTCYKSDIDKYC